MDEMQRQDRAVQHRLSSDADRVVVEVIPQHPDTTPVPIEVTVRAPILAGPVGPAVAVFDYDREGDRVLPAATPRADGSFPSYDVSDPRFHQLNAYAVASRAIDLVETELGRVLGWGFDANRLIVLPHAGYWANAFYEESTHSIQFYSFRRLSGEIYHTSLVHDVVAHEVGHALLDAVRERYTESTEPDTAAVHEAIGDIAAVFAAFSHEVNRERFLETAGDDLRGPNEIASIAELFRASAEGDIALRDLAAPVDHAAHDASADPHERSLRLSAATWETLVRFHAANRGRLNVSDSFRLARTALQRMIVRSFDYLPPSDATFADVGRAILRADRFANPADAFGYRGIIAETFAEFGIVASASALTDESDADPAWDALPVTWPRITHQEAYLFLDRNRQRLALSTQAKYRDFVVRDLHLVSRPPEHDVVDAVVMTYQYVVDVELKGDRYGGLDGYWLPVLGGGALVFDADGRLRHHAEKPVTGERVKGALRFVASLPRAALQPLGMGAEDRVRARLIRSPYIASRAGDRVTIRTTPAARCGVPQERLPVLRGHAR